jgi:uncharacterized protein (TIGR02453 family)
MAHFSPAFFDFLRELVDNNNREWFTRNKARYERDVKGPLHAFVAALAPRMADVDPNVAVDDKSVFRIYRDTRFSADKSPYKTHAAAHFPRRADRGVHTPGYYLHLGPDRVYGGGGLWHPEPPALTRIRDAIVASSERWKGVLREVPPLSGESLTRAPRGYPADHPCAEDLRRKDFTTGQTFTESEACGDDFLDQYVDACRRMAPLVGFLSDALGV